MKNTKIEKKGELPTKYLRGDRPVVWQESAGNKDLHIKPEGSKMRTIYLTRTFYAPAEMTERLSLIIEAGQHLTDVNAELREARAAWNGPVTFVDGLTVDDDENGMGKDDGPEDQKPFDRPIELAEKIAKLWRENRLLHRDNAGHIRPIKPCE